MHNDIKKIFCIKYKVAMVTGGAGFIGSNLVENLLLLGIEVRVIDNFIAGKMSNLEHLSTSSNLTIHNVDVTDFDELSRVVDGVDIIFHNAASKKNVCLTDPSRDLDVNGRGTMNIMLVAKKFNIKKVVHASTGSVYGSSEKKINEMSCVNPISYYGVSKLAGDRYVDVFSRLHSINSSILRYFHVYGNRQENDPLLGGVVAIFLNQIMSNEPITLHDDGEQVRYFTFVDDIVLANLLVAVREEYGEIYNVVASEKITLNNLISELTYLSGLKNNPIIKRHDKLIGDIKDFDLDNSKIRSLGLQFTPLRDGLRKMFDYTVRISDE